ncbi:FAD-binding oxidoreductase [Bacillus sp. 03113]|uniref:NAD(P)/FAD-dependent oxidoreductase n=1 Tax=Bacillus sp. 03113 TaxID=2578211 RepID=UPI0011417E68|nr:FAD-binding oxidoreductase [Bacillus sp. 03113]
MEKIIIIGGGIVGMSAANSLSKAKCHVTVIDRSDAGQATDAAAGIICPWLSKRRNKAWYELAKNGARYYHQLTKDLNADVQMDTGYRQVGALCIRENKDALTDLAEMASLRRKEAPEIGEITLLTEEQAKAEFPLLREGFSAVKVSGGARVSGRALRLALEASAKKNGAVIIRDTAVLHVNAGKVDGVTLTSNLRHLKADKIIVAPGAWARDILSPLGKIVDIGPQKGQLLHVQLDVDTKLWPVILPPSSQSIVPFDGGRLVIGATHEKNQGFDIAPTVGGINEIITEALKFAPDIVHAKLKEIRVGSRAFTTDFSPFIGQVPDHPMIWMASGLGASGLTTGPFIGHLLAQAVMDQSLEIDIQPYQLKPYVEMK